MFVVRTMAVVLMAAVASLAGLAGASAAVGWDRAANIGDAANRLVEMHRERGSQGVLKFLDACYKTHTLASEFKAPLEACLAQDYMHTRVLIEIYGRLPEETRARFNAPDASKIELALNHRFSLVMKQYAIPEADAQELLRSIETLGLPIFVKGVMPQQEAVPGAEPKHEPQVGKP